MIEATILHYLEAHLNYPVYMLKPADPPKRFYLLELTGASLSETIFSATLALQSYAPTLLDAAEMSRTAIDVMIGAVELDEVARVDLNTNYNYTDPETKQPRYQAVFDVVHY